MKYLDQCIQFFRDPKVQRYLKPAGVVLLSAASLLLMLLTLPALLLRSPQDIGLPYQAGELQLMDCYDQYIAEHRASAIESAMAVKKVYWLRDEDLVAPAPDQAKYGATTDPGTLQWLLDEAAELLDGQSTLFTTDTEIMPGTEVQYYLDETILSITWKQSIDQACYNFNEVRIAHPSQIRRYLADGKFDSRRHYTNTQMSALVNAVCSTNADFYKYRPLGVVVYNGTVYRSENTPDVCFIDDQGEMILVPGHTFKSKEEVEAYVEDHNIRFSLSFGPILVEDYQVAVPATYPLGEINDHFTRAALADLGDLHYLVVVNSFEQNHNDMPTLKAFAQVVQSFGCEKAYTLDGGQTGIIVMNDKMYNTPNYGTERYVSDILYFATAVPEGGNTP